MYNINVVNSYGSGSQALAVSANNGVSRDLDPFPPLNADTWDFRIKDTTLALSKDIKTLSSPKRATSSTPNATSKALLISSSAKPPPHGSTVALSAYSQNRMGRSQLLVAPPLIPATTSSTKPQSRPHLDKPSLQALTTLADRGETMLELHFNTPACLLSSTRLAGISGTLAMREQTTSLSLNTRTLALELQGQGQALRRLSVKHLLSVTSWEAAMPVLRMLIPRIFESGSCWREWQYAHDESRSEQVQ